MAMNIGRHKRHHQCKITTLSWRCCAVGHQPAQGIRKPCAQLDERKIALCIALQFSRRVASNCIVGEWHEESVIVPLNRHRSTRELRWVTDRRAVFVLSALGGSGWRCCSFAYQNSVYYYHLTPKGVEYREWERSFNLMQSTFVLYYQKWYSQVYQFGWASLVNSRTKR